MPLVWWGLVGLGAAALVNYAADCWLNPARGGPPRYPARVLVVWFGLPALFMVLAGRLDAPDVLRPALGATVLALLAAVDLEQRRVPNVIVLPATALALLAAWGDGHGPSAVAGALLAGGGFLVLAVIGRRLFGRDALGMGDVKLAAFIGALVGLERMPLALLLGVLLAGLVAAGLLLSGRARRGDSLAYGSCLALAALVVLVISH
jgi:leader peptidase (prepilin peptidase)/N-methyltransferase